MLCKVMAVERRACCRHHAESYLDNIVTTIPRNRQRAIEHMAGNFCKPCCTLFSNAAVMANLAAQLTPLGNAFHGPTDYDIDQANRITTGSNHGCQFCTFIFAGSARFQRNLKSRKQRSNQRGRLYQTHKRSTARAIGRLCTPAPALPYLSLSTYTY